MIILAWISLASAQPESVCLTQFGQTACGYDCKAAYGQVRCAQTAYGSCHAAYGQVGCGPAPVDNTPGRDWPRAQCLARYGQIACGYDCKAGYGQVGCSPVPWGTCIAAFDGVTCYQPAPQLFVAAPIAMPPTSQCIAGFGQRACGFNCVAERGVVACGPTPVAMCSVAADGTATCAEQPAILAPVVLPQSTSPP
jgi:hypothetical protein